MLAIRESKRPLQSRRLSLILRHDVGCLRGVGLWKLAGMVLEVGRGLNQPGRYDRIGAHLGHLEQGRGCLASVKVVLGHSDTVPFGL